jgi:hypothetical protein
MDPMENTPGIVDKACLLPRYLPIDLLFHAVASAEIYLATRYVTMGMAWTTQQFLQYLFYCCLCVFRALPRNGSTCHFPPSLRLFVPNSLSVCHPSFPRSLPVTSHLPTSCLDFSLQWLLSSRYHCSLLKATRPKQLPDKVPVDQVYQHHPVFFFSNGGGKTIPSGQCSHISSSYSM